MTASEKERLDAIALVGEKYGLTRDALVPGLLTTPEEKDRIKGKSVIGRRIAAGYYVTKYARALLAGESPDLAAFRQRVRDYGVDTDLMPLEREVFEEEAGAKELQLVAENSEALAILLWSMGACGAPLDPNTPADFEKVARFVEGAGNIQTLIERIDYHTEEAICAMIDLYRQYHHAGLGQDALLRPRLQALEWFICADKDWLRIRV